MKSSVKSIAAIAAAVTMAFSCVPMAYAIEDVPDAPTETAAEAKKASVSFEEHAPVEVPYNGRICLIADDGTVYYEGSDTDAKCVYYFSLDENGEIVKSYKVSSYVNDKGERIGMMDSRFKQCGEYFYLIYSECYGLSMRETVIIKLDSELNEVAKYRAPKSWNIDTNGEKIVYMKGSKTIYSTDMDGKNKQELFKAGQDNELNGMNFIVVSGDYVGFQGHSGDSFSPKNNKDYCGIIDLKTGEVTLKEQRSVQQLYESNGKIIWYSSESRDIRDSYMITVPEGEDSSAYCREYTEKHTEYFKDGESYVLDGGEFYTLKTQSPRESFDLTVDDDGNVITKSYDSKSGNMVFKIYRDNKLLDTYSVSVKGFCSFVANNGVITFYYTGREPQPGDWVSIDPNMSDEEYEEYLESMPKIDYQMRSVTINYTVNE